MNLGAGCQDECNHQKKNIFVIKLNSFPVETEVAYKKRIAELENRKTSMTTYYCY